ncbi:hypothetical protein BGZ58_000279 [Dissophora ornata]|nr:hypothetical protein BGZ58_000279 [Dissophora ornata]
MSHALQKTTTKQRIHPLFANTARARALNRDGYFEFYSQNGTTNNNDGSPQNESVFLSCRDPDNELSEQQNASSPSTFIINNEGDNAPDRFDDVFGDFLDDTAVTSHLDKGKRKATEPIEKQPIKRMPQRLSEGMHRDQPAQSTSLQLPPIFNAGTNGDGDIATKTRAREERAMARAQEIVPDTQLAPLPKQHDEHGADAGPVTKIRMREAQAMLQAHGARSDTLRYGNDYSVRYAKLHLNIKGRQSVGLPVFESAIFADFRTQLRERMRTESSPIADSLRNNAPAIHSESRAVKSKLNGIDNKLNVDLIGAFDRRMDHHKHLWLSFISNTISEALGASLDEIKDVQRNDLREIRITFYLSLKSVLNDIHCTLNEAEEVEL